MSKTNLHLKFDTKSQPTDNRAKMHTKAVLHPFNSREGAAFCIVSISETYGVSEPLLTFLDDSLEELAESIPKDANVQHRFEQFLSNLNQKIQEKVRSGLWSMSIESVSAVIGVATPKEMYLTGTGELTTLFLHKKPDDDSYQIFNLNRSIQTEQAKPEWEKLFAVVLDGDLHDGDVLCLANLELDRLIPSDELNTTLAKLPPKSAIEKIQQSLPDDNPLSILIITSQALKKPKDANEAARPLSHQSIEKLGETQKQTEDTLADKKPAPIKLLKKIPEFIRKRKGVLGTTLAVIALFFTAAFKIIIGLCQKIGHLALIIFKKQDRKTALKSSKRAVEEKTDRFKNKYKHLPDVSKKLLLAAGGLLLVFVISLGLLNRSQEQQQVKVAYQGQLQEISDVIDRAEGAVIYKDEEQARSLYQEARTAIDDLSQPETQEQENRLETLRERIETGMKDVNRITTIENPEVLAEVKSNETTGNGKSLTTFNASLYLFDDERNAYRVNRENNTLENIEPQTGQIGTPQETALSDSLIYILENRPGLSTFDPEANTLQITEHVPSEGSVWQDIAVYANNVYILETNNESGQILKLANTGSGLGNPTGWFPVRQVELQNARSLTIDGTIFTITQDGTITRFLQGQQTDWTPNTIEPPLENPSDIYTNRESDHVYILDPLQNRLVVLDKTDGGLTVQYQSESFSGLQDMVVDEANNQIFLLTETHVYRLPMEFIQ